MHRTEGNETAFSFASNPDSRVDNMIFNYISLVDYRSDAEIIPNVIRKSLAVREEDGNDLVCVCEVGALGTSEANCRTQVGLVAGLSSK
jgi:hypothetical protein